MEVEVVSSTIIPSAAVTTTSVEITLTVFDKLASDMHVAVLYALSPPTPTSREIIDGLVETLHFFPALAGEFTDCGTLVLGGRSGGVFVVETRISSDLPDNFGLDPTRDLLRLHPSVEEPKCLLQIQLNQFRCGGLVIGATAHHRVADGQSMSNFFIAWGRVVRGLDVEPIPVFDRSWVTTSGKSSPEFQHWGVEFLHRNDDDHCSQNAVQKHMEPRNICNLHLHYTCDFITNHLKRTIREKHTTFVSLLAHVWRKITIARGLNWEDSTRIRVAINGRRRLDPLVPPEFFGNLVVNAYPTSKVKDLISGGTIEAARTIHGSITGVGEEYIRSLIDFGEKMEREMLTPSSDEEGTVLCPNLEVDSWLGFPFNDVDFGGGSRVLRFCPTWIPVEGVIVFSPSMEKDGEGRGGSRVLRFCPTWIPVEGVIVFSPSMEKDGEGRGGVDVIVTLFEEHAKVFRKISHVVDDD